MAGNLTAMIASIFSGGVTADPYYEYTTLLLPGNGTNGAQNNTFLDASTNNFTITRNGNTTQGTFSPFSQTGWGNYFDGAGGCLTTTWTAIGSNSFTCEAWVYITEGTNRKYIVGPGTDTASSDDGFGLEIQGQTLSMWASSTGSGWNLVTSDTSQGKSANPVPLNAWTHVAMTRDSSGVFRSFINGKLECVVSPGTAALASTSVLNVGRSSYLGGFAYFLGYISNLRIVSNSVVSDYATSSTTVGTQIFTPPTAPLTAISGTSLLACQSNRFKDNSTNNFTITRNGDTRVVAFSPFNPTSSWSAATNGGSGYFDGTGDYLTVANSAALSYETGSFTIEGWFYSSATNQYASIFSDENSNGTLGLTLLMNPTAGNGQLVFYGNGSLLVTATGKYNDNAWHHFAISRDSTSLRLYVDGAYIGSSASGSTNFNASQPLYLMSSQVPSGRTMAGYLSNFRTLKGTALYTGTGTITVPTAPLTAITNTSLLLNFTNAGIYDATSKNDLETLDNTVNGVRISTAQSQFGGSSILFDGTGTDYLWIQADQPIQRFGTGKFTIELWIRLAATGSARGLVAKGTSTTGWLVSLNTSNQVVFTYGTSTITSTGTISASVWTYIAVVREGTGTNQTKIYINGTNDGTGTVSTDFSQTNAMYLGANRTGGDLFSGYMQDVRITNGIARTITSTPTAAFPTL